MKAAALLLALLAAPVDGRTPEQKLDEALAQQSPERVREALALGAPLEPGLRRWMAEGWPFVWMDLDAPEITFLREAGLPADRLAALVAGADLPWIEGDEAFPLRHAFGVSADGSRFESHGLVLDVARVAGAMRVAASCARPPLVGGRAVTIAGADGDAIRVEQRLVVRVSAPVDFPYDPLSFVASLPATTTGWALLPTSREFYLPEDPVFALPDGALAAVRAARGDDVPPEAVTMAVAEREWRVLRAGPNGWVEVGRFAIALPAYEICC